MGWLTSSALSRITPVLRLLPSNLWPTSWPSWRVACPMLRLLLPGRQGCHGQAGEQDPRPGGRACQHPARTGESAEAYQRAERKCKELVFSSGEDKKNQDRMSDLAAKLQSKIKTYKQQIEEAEEIAALNLAKFRKAQQELEEAEERAKLASLI